VLATHWAVDDEAMAALVTDLARRLADGPPVAQALHEVQVAWLAAQDGTLLAHPYFWGALTPVGVNA
jgi:CHAT domain-containing protein